MIDIDEVIGYNIQIELKSQNKSKEDLAKALGVPDRKLNRYLDGADKISYPVLCEIIDFLQVDKERILYIPDDYISPIDNLLNQVDSKETKDGIKILDTISDMIVFHTKVKKNGEKAQEPVK